MLPVISVEVKLQPVKFSLSELKFGLFLPLFARMSRGDSNEQFLLKEIMLVWEWSAFASVKVSARAALSLSECEWNVVCENSAFFIPAGNESILSELFEVVRWLK